MERNYNCHKHRVRGNNESTEHELALDTEISKCDSQCDSFGKAVNG